MGFYTVVLNITKEDILLTLPDTGQTRGNQGDTLPLHININTCTDTRPVVTRETLSLSILTSTLPDTAHVRPVVTRETLSLSTLTSTLVQIQDLW